MNNSREKMIDLKDLLVEILFRWKSILVITLIITLLAAGFGILRSGQSDKEPLEEELSQKVIKEQEELLLKEARAMITDTEAQDVERVYRQYKSYIEYRNLYQEELDNYDKAFDKTGDEMMIKTVNYRVSSNLEGVEMQFSTYAIDIEDYRKIVKIHPDVETLAGAYKHITCWTSAAAATTELTNFGEKTVTIPTDYMITLEILGNTRDVCEEVWGIVDAAFQKKHKELKKIDPDIELELVGSNYRGNIYEYYINKKQGTVDGIQKVDTTIHNLRLYSIDKFSADQKAYFNALMDPERGLIDKGIISAEELSENEEVVSESGRLSKKILVLGVIGGLFLSMIYVLSRYLFRGTINVGQEMQDYYRIPVLSTFFIPGGRGKGLFPGLIRKLLHVDSTEAETKAAMVAADACSAVKQAEGDSIYIVQTCDHTEDSRIASILKEAVSAHSPKILASTGMPLAGVEEMQSLTDDRCALFLVHNKKTLQADVEKLLDLCSRHSIKVLGTVAITDL